MTDIDPELRERIEETTIWEYRSGALTSRVEFESMESECGFAKKVVDAIQECEDGKTPETTIRFRGYVLEMEIVPVKDVKESEVELAEDIERRLSEMEL